MGTIRAATGRGALGRSRAASSQRGATRRTNEESVDGVVLRSWALPALRRPCRAIGRRRP